MESILIDKATLFSGDEQQYSHEEKYNSQVEEDSQVWESWDEESQVDKDSQVENSDSKKLNQVRGRNWCWQRDKKIRRKHNMTAMMKMSVYRKTNSICMIKKIHRKVCQKWY